MLIDTHVHLDKFDDSDITPIMDRAADVGVGFVISAGTTIKSTKRCINLSVNRPNFFSGVGVHPMDLEAPLNDGDYETLRDLALSSDKVVVMSEIGLDFMDNMPDRSWQYSAFREQIYLARMLDLPIVFHSRNSHKECFRILREERAYQVGGIMHYFQGSLYDAEAAIDLGFYISIARPIFRLDSLRDVVKKLPIDKIVLETDSFPQPFKKNRMNWTEPRHLRDILQEVALIHSREIDEVEQIIFENTRKALRSKWANIVKYIPSA